MPYTKHSRSFRENRYVYPVLSRRSKGISVGINLNPDRVCNFNCIYCQVDRKTEKENGEAKASPTLGRGDFSRPFSGEKKINLSPFSICEELMETLELVKTGRLFSISPFVSVPAELRHLSDIAISGDGEPTTFPYFYEVVESILYTKKGCFDDVRLVLITNASGLNRPKVQDALELMYSHNGEIWAKLDAGSDSYYRRVSRSNVLFRNIVQNITSAAKRYPVVIQSCFNRICGSPPAISEIEGYSLILKEIAESGGHIRLVQLYTVSRPAAEHYVAPLSEAELTVIAGKVKEVSKQPVEIYP